jgi:hypothetical protein
MEIEMGHDPVHEVAIVVLRTRANIQLSKYSYSIRYSNPTERYRCGFSPNGMYLAGSKKSVRFEGSARRLQFCSAGNGFKGGRAGSGGGPGGGGFGVCARAGSAEREEKSDQNEVPTARN